MRKLLLLLWGCAFIAWGGCDEVDSSAQKLGDRILSSESEYFVNDAQRVYFYSAPDELCKIKNIFIIKGDVVNAYSDYKGFTSVMYLTKKGSVINGWVHSDLIKPTGNGVAPRQ